MPQPASIAAPQPIRLEFKSVLAAAPERVWQCATSMDGIRRETMPLFSMTAPAGIADLVGSDASRVVLGKPLFRSWILLFGVLPVDYLDLTLIELDQGRGFVEQSPMASMKLWRHERRIVPQGQGCLLTDTLTFQPRYASGLLTWLVRRVFTHRHAMLKRYLGAT